MATSLSVLLTNKLPPPRAKRERQYAVKVVSRRPRVDPIFFDVIVSPGLILRGCSVRVRSGERFVVAPGHEFIDREAARDFSAAVLQALDGDK